MENTPDNTQALPAGTRIEEFIIERVLGSGGFGITYLAQHLRLDQQVVIKENLPVAFALRDPDTLTVAPRGTHADDVEDFKWSLENFSKEAAMLASLDHPGIVKVLRSFKAFGTAYYVMPFVEAKTLEELARERRDENQNFSEKELRLLIEMILDALGYLHDRGICHREVEPGNILITDGRFPILNDFGHARYPTSYKRSYTIIETQGCTPFEQLQSRGNVGPWSDLYALAATVVKFITDEWPPKAVDRLFNDSWQPLVGCEKLRANFSESFLFCLDKALMFPVNERWQSASEWSSSMTGGGASSAMSRWNDGFHSGRIPKEPPSPLYLGRPPSTRSPLPLMDDFQQCNQELAVGTFLEEFIIERVLGSGGFGITYLAKDNSLNRQVVIKENLPVELAWRDTASGTVRPRHNSDKGVVDYEWALKSFLRESETLASLDHPGIVRVLRKFETNGTAYFVMPFHDGWAFNSEIDLRRTKGIPFSEEEIIGFLEHMLDALAYLHARGIYHRDIKPANILLSKKGVPLLIDFGAARQKLSEHSMTAIESPGYTPFEQTQSRGNVGPWSDLYALGGTVFKAITFETPPKVNDRALDDSLIPLASREELLGRYSKHLLAGVDRAMAVRIENRWQNAEEWLELVNRTD